MALSIKNPEVERLARELSARTGEGITEVILMALREQAKKNLPKSKSPGETYHSILEISKRFRELPDYDTRPPKEIIDDLYD